MAQYIISDKDYNENNVDYIGSSLNDLFVQTESIATKKRLGSRIVISITCPEFYSDIIKAELYDKISDVITINYKYEYFKRLINPHGLSEIEKELLLTSLIAADIEEDKRYSISKFKEYDEISIDGTYNFRLKLLKKKWEEIVGYMPEYFINTQLKEFIVYLLNGKKKKVYVESGKVYDCDFRRLNRGLLMDNKLEKGKVIREILLSGSGSVDLSGELSDVDEFYLKEYYGENVNFTNRFFS